MDKQQRDALKAWLESPEYAVGYKLFQEQRARTLYMGQGWKQDVGFERVSDRSHRVRCVICGRQGCGITGDYSELIGRNLYGWQRACMKPHTEPCACGKYFPTKHALAMHVQANRRHRIPGHGRMDQVG